MSNDATFLLLMAGACALVLQCSSSTSPAAPTPCNQNPWECAAGQTCWATDAVPTFACVTSGSGQRGDSCLSTVGTATCGDALLCLQTMAGSPGQCRAFCDPATHGCAAGETCAAAALNGNLNALVHICVGGSAPDAGPDAPATD